MKKRGMENYTLEQDLKAIDKIQRYNSVAAQPQPAYLTAILANPPALTASFSANFQPPQYFNPSALTPAVLPSALYGYVIGVPAAAQPQQPNYGNMLQPRPLSVWDRQRPSSPSLGDEVDAGDSGWVIHR